MFIGDTTMFSQRLKILRKSFDLSQAKFAKEIGFSQSAIASWENETREPGINALIKIAHHRDNARKARPASTRYARACQYLSGAFPCSPFANSRICPLFCRKIRRSFYPPKSIKQKKSGYFHFGNNHKGETHGNQTKTF